MTVPELRLGNRVAGRYSEKLGARQGHSVLKPSLAPETTVPEAALPTVVSGETSGAAEVTESARAQF